MYQVWGTLGPPSVAKLQLPSAQHAWPMGRDDGSLANIRQAKDCLPVRTEHTGEQLWPSDAACALHAEDTRFKLQEGLGRIPA